MSRQLELGLNMAGLAVRQRVIQRSNLITNVTTIVSRTMYNQLTKQSMQQMLYCKL
jgi:hypothetical protein